MQKDAKEEDLKKVQAGPRMCALQLPPLPQPCTPSCCRPRAGLLTTTSSLQAYRKLALKWHPDRNRDKVEEATEKFKEARTGGWGWGVGWAREVCLHAYHTRAHHRLKHGRMCRPDLLLGIRARRARRGRMPGAQPS